MTGRVRPAAWLAVLLAVALLAVDCAPAGTTLTVVSWGGSYGRAVSRAYLEPFAAATGIEVRLDDYNGGLAQIRAQVET
ncbi:MAG: ABC transporter substrate-binding protein, partial [Acidobacteria bacterium]|nr:ABC transporter substrate-binding protein [Acidobacteriota bacterium]